LDQVSIFAQQQNDVQWNWSMYALESFHLESTFLNKNRPSKLGFGVDLGYEFQSGVGVTGRASFRKWDAFDKTIIPVIIGPSYRFPSTSKFSLVLYGGFGPAWIWGNDYGSMFAGSELGLRLERELNNKRIFLGTSVAQGMSFHPDHFEYMDIFLGIRL